jgi:hypothetical protein
MCTFLSKPSSLVRLKLIRITRTLHTRIAPRLGKGQLHGFLEQLEPLHLIYGLLRALGRVEDDECLALGSQIRLCDDVDDLAIFAEELAERLLELLDLDALLEIADVDSGMC